MLFSVIIPTYSPGESLTKLLDSIYSNYCINEIEVIISDDCTEESFDELLTGYDDLTIRVIKNEYHHGFPRAGRQHGMEEAQGKWITFIDQDDYFEPNTFDEVKKAIVLNDLKNYIITSIRTMQPTGEIITAYECPSQGTQGKFYEKAFIEKYNLKYDEVDYDEDVNFTVHVQCKLIINNLESTGVNCLTYNWIQHPGSLSDILHHDTYFFHSLEDHLKSTFGIMYYELEELKKENKMTDELLEFFKSNLTCMLFRTYFDFMGVTFPKNNCPPLEESYFRFLKQCFDHYKKDLNMTAADLIEYVTTDSEMLLQFNVHRHETYLYIPFIENMTFEQWIYKYLN